MPETRPTPSASAARWCVVAFGAFAIVAGALALVGWVAQLPRLTDWVGSGISMFPNTAIAAVTSGCALLLVSTSRRWAIRTCAWLGTAVALLGIATLFEHFSQISLGIDTIIIAPTWGNRAAMAHGRMGPPASTSFTLLGIALTLAATLRPRARKWAPSLGIVVALASALSLLGYACGADPLFAIARFTGIAMQTATILLALSVALIASVPEHEPMRTLGADSAAGLLARRSLPFIIAVPIILGLVRVHGRRAGWFDMAMGTSLLALATIAVFSMLLWWWVRAVAKHEEASRASEALLSSVLKQLPVGLGVSDINGKWVLSNALVDEVAPAAIPSAAPQRAKRWRVFDSEGNLVARENWPGRRALRGEIVSPGIDALFARDDGSERWMRISAAPLRDAAGQVIGAVDVIEDIDVIKRANMKIAEQARALEAAHERLQGIFASAMDAVISFDGRQNILLFNPAAEQMFGLTSREVVGRPILRLIPELAYATRLEDFHENGVSQRRTISGQRVSGETFPAEGSISQITIGDDRIITVILRDITERKKAEEHMGRLAAIIENSSQAIFGKTLDGIITSWNPGAEALFGYSATEMIGRSVRTIIPPELQAEEDLILMQNRAGESVHRETVRLRKNGSRVAVSLNCSPVRDASGRIIGAAKIVRDISEEKATEAKLQEAQRQLLLHAADLEATVAERTARLRETVNDLQTFSYSIAHDMRAPLRAMGMFAQLLQEEIDAGALSPAARDYCARIIVGGSRLDNLIHDALNYTKAALREVSVQPVNLATLMRGLVDTYPNLHADNADICVENGLPVVLGNESLLTQCFSNLLGNAVKFVAPGVRPVVRVRSEATDGSTRIWVEDNGIGIPPHAQPRLFSMFQKLDNRYEGTGIGLAIVRKVVERMGGQVGVESVPDHGSRFWVELKLAPEEARP